MNSFLSFAILLAVSSVSAYPMGDYSEMTWHIIYPELNSSLVEYCFFNKSEWINKPESENSKWCQVVVKPSYDDFIRYPDQLLRLLTNLYEEHVANEQNDQMQVLRCFVAHRMNGNVSECDKIVFTNLLGKTWSQRETQVKNYLNLLSNVSSQIDLCWKLINSTIDDAKLFECDLVNDIMLVNHCSHYHTSKLMPTYGPCEQVANPPSTPPTEVRSIARYLEWANITAKNEHDMLPFNDLPERYKRYQHVLNNCFHTNEWLNNPDDWCHKIVKPVDNVKYSWLNQLLQKEWRRVTGKMIHEDCTVYHKDQMSNSSSVCSTFAKSCEPK